MWENYPGGNPDEGPDDMANAGSWFAVCSTLVPGFEAAGLQKQLFWASNEAVEGPNCTFVVLQGADLDNQGP